LFGPSTTLLVGLKDVNLSIGKLIGWLCAGTRKSNRVCVEKCRSLKLMLLSVSKVTKTPPHWVQLSRS